MSALYLHTEVFSQLHQALVGDRWEDRCTLRCHVGIVLDAKEVGSTTLVHVLFLLGIEIELACIALLVSNIVGSERSSIVATHLIYTCSERSRAVEITNDDIRVGRETTLEVRTYRSDENEEAILCGRMNTHLCAGTDEERTDIECSTTLIGRNPLLVESNHLLYHFLKHLSRYFRHHNATACTLQASSILIHTEYAHLAVRTAISLQAFECFLSIVKAGSSHVQFEILIRANFYFAPFSVAIVAANIVIGLAIAKRQIRPIQVFHNIYFFNVLLIFSCKSTK